MANNGILGHIFKRLFGKNIRGIEKALANDPKIKKIAKELDDSLEELEDAVNSYLETEYME